MAASGEPAAEADVGTCLVSALMGVRFRLSRGLDEFRTSLDLQHHKGEKSVELLVVLAIIILLVGILLVGLNQAAGTAQAAQTRFLMNSMAAGLVQFKRDHGYLPCDHDSDAPTPVAYSKVYSYSYVTLHSAWNRFGLITFVNKLLVGACFI